MPIEPVSYSSFAEFLASGTAGRVTQADIAGVIYSQRTAEPLHDGFKYQDAAGGWWSPDYYVVATGGQSNMVGSGTGGSHELSGNVLALDPVTMQIVDSSYGGNFNTGDRDNLYLPFANELSAKLGRPVLVITGAVSGSVINSWLENGDGTVAEGDGLLWAALQTRIAAALALVGQDHVDSFLWVQGESNATQTEIADYVKHVTAFIAQVRGQGWAAPDMAMLIGELSREGVNSTQNQALQALELAMRGDAFLRFVSSTGLTSADKDGVHFDGASLDAFGHRFFKALQDVMAGRLPETDRAPVIDVKPEAPVAITLMEGESFHLSADMFFSDPDGDAMWLYGAFPSRKVPYFLQSEGGDLVLSPGYSAVGDSTYTLQLYANDYWLDSARISITVTVLNRAPGVVQMATPESTDVVDAWATLDQALVQVGKSRFLDVLTPDALGRGQWARVTVDNLTIRGGDGLPVDFAMSGGALRLTLLGTADFDVRGSGAANTIFGNDGINRLSGGGGLDKLYGGEGNDRLNGGGGQDFLFGDAGNDLLMGQAGDDRLYGGDGDDRLIGQTGRDQYWGGEGDDTFVFRFDKHAASTPERELLVIRDFDLGHDVVEIRGFKGVKSADALTDFADFFTDNQDGLRIFIGAQEVQFYGLSVADMDRMDFQFA